MNQEDRESCEYEVELDEIYLFPTSEHRNLITEMAERYPVPKWVIVYHFLSRRPMGEWLKTLWARRLEPTKESYHEITPILSRVRHGCAKEREYLWLGDRITVAIMLDDHDFLKKVFRLATKPIVIKQGFQLNLAAFDFYNEHKRIPSFSELQQYVQNAKGEQAERYEAIDEDNWTRHVRRGGLSWLFKCREDDRQ